jgi:hypothetical protein
MLRLVRPIHCHDHGVDPGRRLALRRVTPAAAMLLAVGLAGCSSTAPSPVQGSTSATYELGPRPVRPDETALRLPTANNGDTAFTLIGLTTGIPTIVGSHAEWQAKGQYVRIRLVVTNTARTSVLFDTRRQLLVDAKGAIVAPDDQAMLIKRQPDKFDLGANVRVEFDLYYDIPKDAKSAALRVFGGPTLTDLQNVTGTDIKLS